MDLRCLTPEDVRAIVAEGGTSMVALFEAACECSSEVLPVLTREEREQFLDMLCVLPAALCRALERDPALWRLLDRTHLEALARIGSPGVAVVCRLLLAGSLEKH